MVLLGLSLLGDVSGFPNGDAEDVIDIARRWSLMASVPFAFLAGLLRSRLSRADAVSDLVARLGEADRRQGLRDALAEALGDPSLSLAYWVPEPEALRRRRRATRSSSRTRDDARLHVRSSTTAGPWR